MTKLVKILFISLGLLTLVIAFYLLFFFQPSSRQQTTPPINGETNKQPPKLPAFTIPSPQEEQMIIPVQDGQVTTANVYKAPLKELSENGVAFADNSDYYLAFYPTPQPGFVITIMNRNITKARALAETEFLKALGITQEEACRLNVSLAVPRIVSETASGVDYGLSFCPNGKPMPTK